MPSSGVPWAFFLGDAFARTAWCPRSGSRSRVSTPRAELGELGRTSKQGHRVAPIPKKSPAHGFPFGFPANPTSQGFPKEDTPDTPRQPNQGWLHFEWESWTSVTPAMFHGSGEKLGPPVVPFSPLLWGRVPLLNRLGYPYFSLSTGGPRKIGETTTRQLSGLKHGAGPLKNILLVEAPKAELPEPTCNRSRFGTPLCVVVCQCHHLFARILDEDSTTMKHRTACFASNGG